MTQPRIVHLDSLKALRDAAEAWDDLWLRSDVTLPLLRAELLAQWVEHFAKPDDFHAIVVEMNGHWVAALPTVRRKVGRILSAAGMPSNEWTASGDFLWDASEGQEVAGTEQVVENRLPIDPNSFRQPAPSPSPERPSPVSPTLAALTEAIREMPWPLLWLDEVVLDAARWQQLHGDFSDARMTMVKRARWQVGRIAIDHDWTAYLSRLSKNHRKKMARAARQLADRGEVRLDVLSQIKPDEVAPTMQRCFEIEDRGWKGTAGTSILRTPGMPGYYIRQAQQAARWGQLEIVFLHCGDRPVAFAYGLSAKGVFHSTKISYDPEFRDQTPGQLLRYFLLERFFSEPHRKALDFQGVMTESHAAWLPECRTIGRWVVAPRSMIGRLSVQAYKHLWPLVRKR